MGGALCRPDCDDARRAAEGTADGPVKYDRLPQPRPDRGLRVPGAKQRCGPPPSPEAAADTEAPPIYTTPGRFDISPDRGARTAAPPSPLAQRLTGPNSEYWRNTAGAYRMGIQRDAETTQWSTIALGTIAVVCVVGLSVFSARSFGASGGFDCSATAGSGDWPQSQVDWCCSNKQVCITTTSLPFDCTSPTAVDTQQWPPGQKAWCCDHFGRGCPEAQTSIPFDCDAAVGAWEREWSVSKKAWCCEHRQVACPTLPPPGSAQEFASVYDCQADFENWGQEWSAHKRAWCCEFKSRGCPTLPPV